MDQSSKLANKGTDEPTLAWWTAAGLVGADIGTSVFYSTSVVLPYVGTSAPLIIATVCATMFLFKTTYEEGCSVSPFNGGAYMSLLQTQGRRWAILIAALTFVSYLFTAVVSALAAAFYLESLAGLKLDAGFTASILLLLFALVNLGRVREPALLILWITAFHFVLLLLMDAWGLQICFARNVDFGILLKDLPTIHPINAMHGFAAAFLGISGFESAAQIVEQLKKPRWKQLRKVYFTIAAMVCITGPLSSALCILLLSSDQLTRFRESLMSGLALVEGGEIFMTILVIDAVLILLAAVNTAFVGITGLCTTMARQGDLPRSLLISSNGVKGFAKNGMTMLILSFTLLCLLIVNKFSKQLDMLGEGYCLAFLGVMIGFSIGVILMRIRLPAKVSHAPFKSEWLIQINNCDLPQATLLGLAVLIVGALTLLCTSPTASALTCGLFALVLLVMLFYRVGKFEHHFDEPDLSLGLGRFYKQKRLPDLPAYVLCTGGANAAVLIRRLVNLLQKSYRSPKEIIIFHAEEEGQPKANDVMFQLLQRVVSQQVAPEFKDEDIVISVKIMSGTLANALSNLQKQKQISAVFMGAAENLERSQRYREDIANHLGVSVYILAEQDDDKSRDSSENHAILADLLKSEIPQDSSTDISIERLEEL